MQITNEQAKSELMQLYGVLSEEKKQALDVLMAQAELQAHVIQSALWIADDSDNGLTCEKCECTIYANDILDGEANYCPNCGTKMEGITWLE